MEEENTNFDTLVKNLENNKELYELVYKIVVENEKMSFNIHNPTTNFASIYGLTQLTDYLNRQNLDTGYLLIFDHSEIKKWHSEWVETAGKKIFIAWV